MCVHERHMHTRFLRFFFFFFSASHAMTLPHAEQKKRRSPILDVVHHLSEHLGEGPFFLIIVRLRFIFQLFVSLFFSRLNVHNTHPSEPHTQAVQ